MISNKEVTYITSLAQKKYRNKYGLFIAEGGKLVRDLLDSKFESYKIYTSDSSKHTDIKQNIEEISEKELKKISQLKSTNNILGIFKIPQKINIKDVGLTLVLDGIQDPGNLGTIIRLCDWYGIRQLVCSKDTVDCYNPKVVQATMGSLARVKIAYTNIEKYLKSSNLKKFLSLLEGENIYTQTLPSEGIIVMGNEGKGIRKEIQELGDRKLTIPKFSQSSNVESLNVAMATAIFLSEFRRQK
jgi:TrmH family RNA methyltransferase